MVPASAPSRIDVDDAGSTMARAEALKARTFYQPVGPGELEIPAIRGVGGSLLYFLEAGGKNWDLDFEALRSDAAADRLDAVDHISQSMPYDEMLSWLLFYTGILDLQRLPQMEIADPVGLVQSQALINGDRACASCSTARRPRARCRPASSTNSSAPASSTSRSPAAISLPRSPTCARGARIS